MAPDLSVNPIQEVVLAEVEGIPRVRDLDLAERLGFARPRDARKLIERNRAEFDAMGICATVAQNHGGGRGRPGTEYWLNEEQSLLLAVLSDAPNAPAVRSMLIKVFVAWRRGRLDSVGLSTDQADLLRRVDGISRMLAHKVTEIEKHVDQRVDQLIEARLASDPRIAVLDFKPALAVLEERKVPTRKRRPFSQKCSSRLRRFCIQHGHEMRESAETKRWLFHVNGIKAWLEAEGERLIADHINALSGQGLLKLVR